jgi:hypothetical protein
LFQSVFYVFRVVLSGTKIKRMAALLSDDYAIYPDGHESSAYAAHSAAYSIVFNG